MTIHADAPRTRRALLAGAIGGLGVWAAAAIGKTSPVLAEGEVLHVGDDFATATSLTRITNSANDSDVIMGKSLGFGTAVTGQGTSGAGLYGYSITGLGVHGFTGENIAVLGDNSSDVHAAVVGRSFSGSTGVLGTSDNGPVPSAKPNTGVYGQGNDTSTSRGVWGHSLAGFGVLGEATTGRGVQGTASSGIGVRAAATSGTGIWASATTGYAVHADGRILLDKSAGLATIASGTSSVSVTPGIDLTSSSAVIATLNGNAGGSTAVKRVAINTTTNAFTIYLTANATAAVKVAWLVVG